VSRKTIYTLATLMTCAALVGLPWLFKAYPFQKQVSAALPSAGAGNQSKSQLSSPASSRSAALPAYLSGASLGGGITRLAQLHTDKPDPSVFEVKPYTVKKGDTIFDIADQFGIQPSTILWGNLTKLADNPEMIYPGQVLNILPVDGVYYEWHEGDGLNGVAKGLGVTPQDIINFPGNHLDENTIGDLSHPNIKPGTWIIVPGGHRNFITWSAPVISRFSPGVAKLYGPGACTQPSDGAVGTGSFTYPTVEHWLSGYDYTPSANHPAVDFAGSMGNAVYAADNGVVVYAGWNDRGYGNVTVIDHGNGYQTLYGHQSVIKVGCGQSVNKGDLIGLMGSTGNSSGPHLHFEMWYNSTHVNPHDYLAIGAK
jgi:murein DD-endopeptidase MepM/ murein hydrolase activator NlpD